MAPENTIPAAKLAWQMGADLWETDVQLTRDGYPILHHDETFLRCTNIDRVFPVKKNEPVSLFSLSQVEKLDAGSFYFRDDPFGQISNGEVSSRQAKKYHGTPVPTLDQGLTLTAELNWRINLELKFYGKTPDDSLPDAVLEVLEKNEIRGDQVIVSSFHHPWLDLVRRRYPDIKVQALVGENEKKTDLDFEDFRFDAYNINANLILPSHIKMLEQRGKTINLFTINEPSVFNRFESMSINGIFTDFPQRFVFPQKKQRPVMQNSL